MSEHRESKDFLRKFQFNACLAQCYGTIFLPFWILLSTQLMCLSRITPKNLIEEFLSTFRFPIFKSGSFNCMLSLEEFLWNKMCLVILIFNETLLDIQWDFISFKPLFDFSNSTFTIEKEYLYFNLVKYGRIISEHNRV